MNDRQALRGPSECDVQRSVALSLFGHNQRRLNHDDSIDFEAFHKTNLDDSDAMFKTMTSSAAERYSCRFEPIANFIND
jgi:hypothetical protein